MTKKESPFKVTGEISFGTIDFQKERAAARDELYILRKRVEQGITAHFEERQELLDRLHQKELELLQLTFNAQIEELRKANRSPGLEEFFC